MQLGPLATRSLCLLAGLTLAPAALSAAPQDMAPAAPQVQPAAEAAPVLETNPFAIFTPTEDPIRHRIDYETWDFILKNMVISMGPSTRQTARPPRSTIGTRRRQGHNSRYRLEGTMLGFSFLTAETIASFTEYREDMQRVGDALDISQIPRNEQLAYWLNLHNMAVAEQIALEWPVRQPRDVMVDGVPMDEAKFITVRGIAMSPRDIREKIVFANWRDPKVIYGFWRGEIGGPALDREAFTGNNVSSLLDILAEEFVNSLRGTQKNGDRLDVSTLYQDTAPFYFADFETDLRTHLAKYALEDVTEILAETDTTRASIAEYDIADLAGGSRGANYLAASVPGVPIGVRELLQLRQRKFENLIRREESTGRVIFSNIDLPGDPPNKNAVQ